MAGCSVEKANHSNALKDRGGAVSSTGQTDIIGRLTDSHLDALFVNSPRSAVISSWYGHVPFAFWLMWALRPRVFVELGTHNGVSYTAFCEAALAASIETRCFAVDTWHGDEHAGFYDESVYTSLQSFHDSHYSAFSRMLRTTFDDAAEYFAGGSIDLLHIDGCHSHHAVLHDFEQWQPKLSDRAVVLFHDTNVRERHFGVWRLWANLRERYPSFEFVHEHGLGVLAVGLDVPEPVRALCQLTDPTAIANLRTRFAQSGRRCVLESELTRTQESLRTAERSEAQLQETRSLLRDAEVARDALAEKDSLSVHVAHEAERLLTIATLASRVRTSLDNAQRQLVETRRQLAETRSELAVTKSALESITQSTTWTVLAPLRAIASGLPGPVRRAARRGLRAAWWGITPWRIPERLRVRREVLAALGRQESAIPPAPESAGPAFDRFALDLIAPLRSDYQLTVTWYDSTRPEVTIIILNWSRGEMTLLCLRHIWQNTSGHRYEIIVVDNSSGTAEIDWLYGQAPMARIIPLGANKFFGEANNIGVEAARGRYACLLNNDAFVSPGWLTPLVDILASDSKVGAVGPSFRYPDGSLREAGALVNSDGSVVQLGKGGRGDDPMFNTARTVDYVSAACILLRRDDFLRVLGFDLTWDPAYYEDVDLCLKLRLTGLRTVYCPGSVVIHIENATLGGPLGLNNIVGINQCKFIARWGRYLETMGRETPNLVPDLQGPDLTPAGLDMRVLIFTPYNLTPGGGERYILTIAEAFRDAAQVVLVAPHPVSRTRLLTMGRELGLDLRHLEPLCLNDFQAQPPFDLAFVLGNAIFPSVGRMGLRNIFICQFPFPLDDEADAPRVRPFWDDFDLVVTYSEFVRSHVSREAAARDLAPRWIEVLSPPVPQITGAPAKRPGQILHVGRFFTGGHCKRQDAMIDAFRGLIRAGIKAELHLAGSTHPEPEHRAYYLGLIEQARGLPVVFHTNCSGEELRQLYAESIIYWHATGVGGDVAAAPHTVEHFGISVVEAMSARCIPIVFAAGGPASIVEDGVTGFHFQTLDQLAAKTQEVLERTSAATLDAIAAAAEAAARAYDEPTFKKKVRHISSGLMTAWGNATPVPALAASAASGSQ